MTRNKYALIFSVGVLMTVLQFCKPAQTTTADSSSKKSEPVIVVSYEKDIRPLMLERCTPCHFPEMGKKKMLDTYETAKTNVQEIITRIQLNPEDPKFMPFKSKKPNLTKEEIQKFNDWLKQGMPN